MNEILYTVRVTLPNEDIAAEYVEWLSGGHSQAICRYADRARIYRMDTASDLIQFESRYDFKDRSTFEKYIQDGAPALREEAVKKFGPSRGIQFERWTAEKVFETKK